MVFFMDVDCVLVFLFYTSLLRIYSSIFNMEYIIANI